MNILLILTAIIIFICILLNRASNKIGIPALIVFILLGMIFGSDGIVKIPFDNYWFAEKICSTALIFILFYGGFGTNWNEAKPVVAKSLLLSSIGVIFTAGITGLFCYFVLNINFLESLLIGSLLSSTDAASVFSILRSKKLNLKYNTASLLEIESGSNDPFAYMLTAIILALMNGNSSDGFIINMLLSQILIGLACGFVIAMLTVWILKRVTFSEAGFDTIFVFSIAIFAYAVPCTFGGNGYLSVYLVGIVMGNSTIGNKKSLVAFFDGINGLMQMLIFFLLGLLSFPSKLLPVLLPSSLIALFLTFIARPISVFLLLTPFKSKISQQLLVSWSGLRGAASIVFAVMAKNSIDTENDIFHIIFCIVLFSILIQGSLLPYIARKLNMIDNSSNVMKTFNDYTDEVPIQFIQFSISKTHPWCDKTVSDIILPPDTILSLLIRNENQIVPTGNTLLLNEDKLILCAKTSEDIHGVQLSEKHITSGNKSIGQTLSEINKKDALVIMIQRNGEVIIPHGNTYVEENDILVLNKRNNKELEV